MQIIKELQRRNVFRVSLGYIMSCWLVVQIADLVLENINAPDWAIQTIMLVLALGFPFVVFFSWAYEVTPEGIKRDSEVDPNQSITGVTGRKLDRAILVLLVLSLGYFIWESRFSDRAGQGESPVNEQVNADSSASGEVDAAPTPAANSIAVLPFDNRSRLEDDVFFTEGIHDELLTNLARIASLKVISRTSVMRYRDTVLPVPEIARELGVTSILEGAVQRSGNMVRINVQLIDAGTDEHLWAETYDRELTADNLFTIQTEISRSIARSLRTELSAAEEARISTRPTHDLDAYDAYLRGRQELHGGEYQNLRNALNRYREATEIDPEFAAAWAGRAMMVLALRETGFWGEIPEQEAFLLAQTNIQRALEIDPQSAEAHTVQARMHYEKYRFNDALDSLDKALSFNPNLADGYREKAQILSSLGRIQEAWAAILMALDRDPFDRRTSGLAISLGAIYLGSEYLRQLSTRLSNQPAVARELQMALTMRTTDDLAELYRSIPPDVVRGIDFLNFLFFREVPRTRVENALHPLEVTMDLYAASGRLDEALATYAKLSEERKQVTINQERLSLPQMAQGRCDEGIASLEAAHGGRVRIYGQIPPSQPRSNPNLALNWVYCMHQTGRREQAEEVLASLREYVDTLQEQAESEWGVLRVKLLLIDGETERALEVYRTESSRNGIPWPSRFDPVIRTLAGNPEFEEINAELDAEINARRARLGWPPTQGFALDSYEGQEVADTTL